MEIDRLANFKAKPQAWSKSVNIVVSEE